MVFYLSLVILILSLGAQLNLRPFRFIKNEIKKTLGVIFVISIVLVFLSELYYSFRQYNLWQSDPTAKFLLPPYQSINYFLFYVFTRFFAPYIISLFFALIFLGWSNFINKKYGEKFLYPEEYYLGSISLFLLGHPGWLIYSLILIGVYLSIHFYSLIVFFMKSRFLPVKEAETPKEDDLNRITLRYLWLPTAIFAILIIQWFLKFEWWKLLKI